MLLLTLCLLINQKYLDAVDVMTERNIKHKSKAKKEEEPKSEEGNADWRSRLNESENILKEDEAVVSAFLEAFSDTDEDDEGEEEEDEE